MTTDEYGAADWRAVALEMQCCRDQEIERRTNAEIRADNATTAAWCAAAAWAVVMGCLVYVAFAWGPAYENGRADALTAVRAQQQAATVALKDAEAIREAAIVAVKLATDALRVCSGEDE